MVLLSRGRWVACGWLSRIVRGWVCGLLFPPYVQVQLVAGQGDLDVLAARVDAGDLGLDHQGVAFWFLDAEPRVQIPVKEAPDRLGQARGRAVIDFVAGLTDNQAVALMEALSGHSRQLWTDAFVL